MNEPPQAEPGSNPTACATRWYGSPRRGFEVLRDGAPVAVPRSRKARALLAYIACTGQTHTREALCDLLWDGTSDPRGELRWCLSRLRPLVNDDAATRLVARDRIGFDAHGASVDLATCARRSAPRPRPRRSRPSSGRPRASAARFSRGSSSVRGSHGAPRQGHAGRRRR